MDRFAAIRAAEKGNVAIIFALSMPLIVGAGGLGVETSFDYLQQVHLQGAADAAAYAAALENRDGSSIAVITGAATDAATNNGWAATTGTLVVHNPPASGANTAPTAVEVLLSQTQPRFFSAYFSATPLVARARAVAVYQTAANACILALNKAASGAVQVQGSASLNLTNCDVMSNSLADDAVNVWGSANLTADCIASAGGVSQKGGITLTGCKSVITQAPRARDPFAGLAVPSPGTKRNIPGGNGKSTVNLSPGSYANGMDLSGKVALAAGTYYVSGGDVKVNAGADVSGSGVTIYLAAGSQVSMNGNATVSLTAPTSGTYSGILFFGDPTATSGSNVFNGNATSNLTGDIYFPTQSVTYQGNFSGSGGCTQIVADTVQWTGNATVSVNCAAYGMSPIPARQAVKLVE